jgi:putative ABC transport system permease protein
MSLVVRTGGDSNSSITADLRHVLRQLDPELPLLKVRTIGDVVDRAVAVRRFQTLLTVFFAASGLFIACLGIYGVVVAAGERRRAELAVRLALGATRRDVVILVALQAAKPVMAGLLAGSIGAIAGARTIQSMLFEVSPNDPVVIAAVCGLVLVIAALACVDPAARAARISPVTLLRTS